MKTLHVNAAFAGQSYPDDGQAILQLFGSRIADSAKTAKKRNATATDILLVPHIDFQVNLDIYAGSYQRLIQRRQFPKIFYLLGVGHQCPHEFSACPIRYRTPLGSVASNLPILTDIARRCAFPIVRSPATFRREHSLEFVVIWLQVLRDLYFPGASFTVVPILLGGLAESMFYGDSPESDVEMVRFGQAVAESFQQQTRGEAMLIASIDGCHVGPRFGHDFPVNPQVQSAVQQWEDQLWRYCRSDRLAEFIGYLQQIQNGLYFDGTGVLFLLLNNFAVAAQREQFASWFEPQDQSLVTFSGGYFSPLKRSNR